MSPIDKAIELGLQIHEHESKAKQYREELRALMRGSAKPSSQKKKRRSPRTALTETEALDRIVTALRKPSTINGLSKAVGLSNHRAKTLIHRLRDQGVVEHIEDGTKNGLWGVRGSAPETRVA